MMGGDTSDSDMDHHHARRRGGGNDDDDGVHAATLRPSAHLNNGSSNRVSNHKDPTPTRIVTGSRLPPSPPLQLVCN